MGAGIAALIGRAMGADEKVVAELEGSDKKDPAIPAEVQTRLSKTESENAELKTRLEKAEAATNELREQAELRKFAEEVAGYKEIGLDPTKDAALLKAVTEKLPKEQSDRIRELFKAAVAQVQAGKLFGEVGSNGMGAQAGTASAEIESKTTAKLGEMRKSNDKVTVEQARDSVFRENPGLYERWAKETTLRV
jgi:hypothetical protein